MLPTETGPAARDGYNVRSWVFRDLGYYAVSDLNDQELAQFAERMLQKTES